MTEASANQQPVVDPTQPGYVCEVCGLTRAEHLHSRLCPKHARAAISFLVDAQGDPDALRQQNKARIAQGWATLALADVVERCTAVLRDIASAEWRARQ